MLDAGMILGIIFIFVIFLMLMIIGWAKDIPRRNRGILNRSNTIYSGSPTRLRFENDKVIDKNGNEVMPRPMKEWLK